MLVESDVVVAHGDEAPIAAALLHVLRSHTASRRQQMLFDVVDNTHERDSVDRHCAPVVADARAVGIDYRHVHDKSEKEWSALAKHVQEAMI